MVCVMVYVMVISDMVYLTLQKKQSLDPSLDLPAAVTVYTSRESGVTHTTKPTPNRQEP